MYYHLFGVQMSVTISKEVIPEPLRWLNFLSRMSLITAIGAATIPIAFLWGIGQEVSDEALGPEYVELLQAARNPGMFRAAWTIDAIIWLMLGGILIAAAGILRHQTPIRARFISVCGLIQTFGGLGSFLRLDGISDIAARYVLTAPAQKAGLLNSYLDLWRVISSLNHIAVLFQGVGFLLVVWGFYTLRGFPRWLAIWFGLPGLLAIVQFGIFITGAAYVFALNVLGLVAGNIALNLAITITMWQPSKELISTLLKSSKTMERGKKDSQ